MTGEPLSLAMQGVIETALTRLSDGSGEHCISELAFENLYLFRAVHDYRFLSGKWPCISGLAYDGSRHLMPLFELTEAPYETLRGLIQQHDCFFPVAPHHTARLSDERFLVSESRDDSDYLYAAEAFVDYAGHALAKKRNQLRQFLAAHTPSSEPFGEHLAVAARDVLKHWMLQKGKSAGEADEEACLEAIDLAARFRLDGMVYFDHQRPIGFLLAQELQPGVFVMRFAKGLDGYKGLYPYMFHHFCTRFARPVAWLNFEQDMGLPGFRRSKMSFHPQALLSKFRVRLVNQSAGVSVKEIL